MKKTMAIVACLLMVQSVLAQQKDSINASPLVLWGYGDFYYAYDFNMPATHERPGFVYSHNRHDEFAINNVILGIRYNRQRIRGAVSLHTGTYVMANYASEPVLLKLIYEAYAGYAIGKKVWLDAGIFSSHIGAESALSIENLTLSRSMMADNTPYYETGVKIGWHPRENLTLTMLLLNGWQNIVENNNNKAVGTQVQFKPLKNFLLNSSTFFGKEKTGYDSLSTMRYFHNFYTQWDLRKFTLLAAFDIGLQRKRASSGANVWYNPNIIARWKATNKLALAARVEYYHDPHGVIIYSGTFHGFQTVSASVNLDYWFSERIAWRTEFRLYNSRDQVFTEKNVPKKNDSLFLTCLAIKL